jgi:hypothetical protein
MRPSISTVTTAFTGVPAETRVAAYYWRALAQELDGFGESYGVAILSSNGERHETRQNGR